MIAIDPPVGNIAMLRVGKGRLYGSLFGGLEETVQSLVRAGHPAILFDMSAVTRLRAGDIAALIELVALALPHSVMGIFGANQTVLQALSDTSADRVIRCFATRARALDCPAFRRHRLSHVSAVLLCGNRRNTLGPIIGDRPAALLDVMGRPVAEHCLNTLADAGLTHVTLMADDPIGDHPSHDTRAMASAFGNGCKTRQTLFYAAKAPDLDPCIDLAQRFGGFTDTTVVMYGDALVECDIAALVDAHAASGADVTDVVLKGTTANGSIPAVTVFSPSAGAALRAVNIGMGTNDWRQVLRSAGCRLQTVNAPGQWRPVFSAQGYFQAWAAAMDGSLPYLRPNAVEIEPGIWVQGKAHLPKRLEVNGKAFFGNGTSVSRGSRFSGTNAVLAGAECAAAYLSNSLLMPGLRADASAWVDGMIAGADWAIHHPTASGRPRTAAALEGVGIRQKSALGTHAIAAAG